MSGYPKINWRQMYRKYFPTHSDPYSRHARLISENLARTKGDVYKMLSEAGYEPDHWAHSIGVTVVNLWETRAELEALKKRLADHP